MSPWRAEAVARLYQREDRDLSPTDWVQAVLGRDPGDDSPHSADDLTLLRLELL